MLSGAQRVGIRIAGGGSADMKELEAAANAGDDHRCPDSIVVLEAREDLEIASQVRALVQAP